MRCPAPTGSVSASSNLSGEISMPVPGNDWKETSVGPNGSELTIRQARSSTASRLTARLMPSELRLPPPTSTKPCRRSMLACTACASTAAPSWKTTPGRMLKTYVTLSGFSTLSASIPATAPSSSKPSMRSKTWLM